MRINFVVPEYTKTGGMRVVLLFAEELIGRGHDVSLYAPGVPFNPYRKQFKPYFIKHRIRKSAGYLFGKGQVDPFFAASRVKINTVPFITDFFIPAADIVIATSWTSAYPVYRLPERKGKKVYLVQDYEAWNSNVKYVDESYKLPLYKVTVSEYLKKLLLEKFDEKSVKILVSPDYRKFYNNDKRFDGPLRILFMDHVLPNKNVEGALAIVRRIKEQYPETVFDCFGVDRFHEIPGFVKFHRNPSDEEIRRLYCDSAIFIFPSLYEGFGMPPAEAMACKCAVAGYASAAIPEYAENRVSALLAQSGDSEGLFECVEGLIKDNELLRNISMAGYEHVKQKLNWEKSTDEFENVLKGLVK